MCGNGMGGLPRPPVRFSHCICCVFACARAVYVALDWVDEPKQAKRKSSPLKLKPKHEMLH